MLCMLSTCFAIIVYLWNADFEGKTRSEWLKLFIWSMAHLTLQLFSHLSKQTMNRQFFHFFKISEVLLSQFLSYIFIIPGFVHTLGEWRKPLTRNQWDIIITITHRSSSFKIGPTHIQERQPRPLISTEVCFILLNLFILQWQQNCTCLTVCLFVNFM